MSELDVKDTRACQYDHVLSSLKTAKEVLKENPQVEIQWPSLVDGRESSLVINGYTVVGMMRVADRLRRRVALNEVYEDETSEIVAYPDPIGEELAERIEVIRGYDE